MMESEKSYVASKSIIFASKIISFVFNPLLIPLWAFLILFNLPAYFSALIPPSAKRMLISVVVVNTSILPLLAIIMLKRLGLIESLDLNNREERLYPLLLGVVMYFLTYYLFQRLNLPAEYSNFLFGAGLIAAGGLLVSLFYKISIHMAAIGGLLGLILIVGMHDAVPTYGWLLAILLATGLTGTARLALNAHTATQVYLGLLMGVGLMFLGFYVL